MKKLLFALCLFVVIAAGCSGPKSNSGPPFLEGLTVNKETPIVVKCRGNRVSGTYPFSNKDEFRAEYSSMKDGQANGKEYAPGNGPVYNFQYFDTCEVTQSGQSFETWTRR